MLSQHWFRWWFGVIRQQAIICTNVHNLQRQMASLGHFELMGNVRIGCCFEGPCENKASDTAHFFITTPNDSFCWFGDHKKMAYKYSRDLKWGMDKLTTHSHTRLREYYWENLRYILLRMYLMYIKSRTIDLYNTKSTTITRQFSNQFQRSKLEQFHKITSKNPIRNMILPRLDKIILRKMHSLETLQSIHTWRVNCYFHKIQRLAFSTNKANTTWVLSNIHA